MMIELESLKYPIGQLEKPAAFTDKIRTLLIDQLEKFPFDLRATAEHMTEDHLKSNYRDGSWTGQQVIHHLSDSHLNSLMRLKLILTEEYPSIKPYIEDRWVRLPDSLLNIEIPLLLIEGVHQKMVAIYRSLQSEDFDRTYFHPQAGSNFDLNHLLALYAWHGRHHLGHLQLILEKSNNKES